MGYSFDEFTFWIEECYCEKSIILIIKEDEDGSSSVLTDMLQAYVVDEYIVFEDDRDYFERIKLDNIISLNHRLGYNGNKTFEIMTSIKTYTYENLGSTL